MSIVSEIPKDFILSNDGMIQPSYTLYRLPYSTEPLKENERIDALVNWISDNVEASPRKHIGSYSGKHVYERDTGKYVSNGEFIMAMRKAGFIRMRIYKGCPNVDFMAKWSIKSKK